MRPGHSFHSSHSVQMWVLQVNNDEQLMLFWTMSREVLKNLVKFCTWNLVSTVASPWQQGKAFGASAPSSFLHGPRCQTAAFTCLHWHSCRAAELCSHTAAVRWWWSLGWIREWKPTCSTVIQLWAGWTPWGPPKDRLYSSEVLVRRNNKAFSCQPPVLKCDGEQGVRSRLLWTVLTLWQGGN